MTAKTGTTPRPRKPSYKAVLAVNCPVCGADVLQLCINLHAPGIQKRMVQDYLRANLHASILASKVPHEARVRWFEHVQAVKAETLRSQRQARRSPPKKTPR